MHRKSFALLGMFALLGVTACGSDNTQSSSAPRSSSVAATTSSASPSATSIATPTISRPAVASDASPAKPGTNCGSVMGDEAGNHVYVFGGKTTCSEASDIIRSFTPRITGQGATATIENFTCEENTQSYRITGAHITCVDSVTGAYIQSRSGIDPIPGYVADSEQYVSASNTETYSYGFAPAGTAEGTFGCGINGGGMGVVCEIAQADGAVSDGPVGGHVKTWKVTMNPSSGVTVEEGGIQGPNETTSQNTALDIGTVINFNGVSCQALSADSVRCIGTEGMGFTISPQGVTQP